MKTRFAFFALVAVLTLTGLAIFLLHASVINYRYRPVQWSASHDSRLTARLDAFDELPANVFNDSHGWGNNSLLVAGIAGVQNDESAMRGFLAAFYSTLPSARLQGDSPSSSPSSLREYSQAVSNDEKKVFLDLLRVINNVTASHNITYFMTFGTLLGSFRHHDMTPWDDDVDVAMPYKDKALVWTVLNDLGRFGYVVNVTANTQFRFFGRKSRLYSPSWKWRWPYIDIDFYSENKTHLWLHCAGKVYCYAKAIIFPLHRRPLGRMSLNAPRDGLTCLRLTFSDYDSCATGMQHKLGRTWKSLTKPCFAFKKTYPFVHRSLTWDKKVLETLKFGNKALYSITVDEPVESAMINPFTLKSL